MSLNITSGMLPKRYQRTPAFAPPFLYFGANKLPRQTSPLPLHAVSSNRRLRPGVVRATLKNSETEAEPSSGSASESPPEAPKFTLRNIPERLRVVLLCFLSFVICNCDRINISVAILPMAKFYGWNQTTVGIIQSAFFWGYVLTQIPGGYFADKYGGKHVLAVGVIVWSAMTLLTPLAASGNLGLLLLARALLGVGEGVAMPAMNNIISKWVPEKERARSLSLTYSGMYLGSVVGLWLCPQFIVSFGWQSVFYIFGSLGFFWWIGWQLWTTSTPQLSSTISEQELRYIESGAPGAEKDVSSVPWKLLLSRKATWAIIVAHFCATWGKLCCVVDSFLCPFHSLHRMYSSITNCDLSLQFERQGTSYFSYGSQHTSTVSLDSTSRPPLFYRFSHGLQCSFPQT